MEIQDQDFTREEKIHALEMKVRRLEDAAPKKKSHLGVILLVGGFLTVMLFSIFMLAGVVGLIISQGGQGGGAIEKVLQQGDGIDSPKIAIVTVSGVIEGDASPLVGEGMAHEVVSGLQAALDDDAVKAVILHVDSPGGGLTASDVIYNEVRELGNSGKPVVVYVGDMAASGGYYVSAPARHIVASPTSLVGSFGVIMEHVQLMELMSKIGVKVEPIKSTGMKDIGSPFREMTEEEHNYFESIMKHYHARFVDIIAGGRSLKKEEVEPLANGKVYTAEQALEYRLIDEIGYFDAALAKAKSLGGISGNPTIVTYGSPPSLRDLLTAKAGFDPKEVLKALHNEATPKIQALWVGRDNE
jgi:protease-4